MRPRTCHCGTCRKCRHRETERARYARLTLEQRREVIARRDVDAARRANRENARRKRADPGERGQKERARAALRRAVRAGTIERGPCADGPDGCEGQVDGHHEDYSRPLDVVWVCKRHHLERHGAAK